ncbi:MAG: macrolide ABC transporter ATP-binding protein [Candidatus Terrybacteria bacterium CG10_big_fil_rev_8_21_14_0_10_41_10]|uniref:Macrolide ABC transporter ATP-binding protein n=1 Tax=Candidatus Terrybacteria bacterium CG10_big_fil_rev_8_21_14_0_10_41_10 TaxID=1975026 RepID=A0A2M8LC03_9BACT|nr:MAG: macrolide ABC transporter ATP-binding protein [Candidatus Terrybacteria bacterium CG10_big_fil_rev_8_21_14_0_10_41_10]
MAFIEARNIEKVYSDGTRALRGVSLDIEKGEFVAIMGSSGSGKSTLLHTLGFLDSYTSGSYSFGDREIKDYSETEVARIRNKRIGFVFQMFNLLQRASVLENVKLPLAYSGIREPLRSKLALEAIESVGLGHRKDFDVAVLSGGEKQRVAIARAIVNDPDVIFADEPTGNLDSGSGKAVMNIFDKMNKERRDRIIVLITHETNTARYAERIIKIGDGKIVDDYVVKDRISGQEEYIK